MVNITKYFNQAVKREAHNKAARKYRMRNRWECNKSALKSYYKCKASKEILRLHRKDGE